MEAALESQSKKPIIELCRWNKELRAEKSDIPSIFDKDNKYRPTIEDPLVYHLYGDTEVPVSMGLTEDDFFDFLNFMYEDYREMFGTRILMSFVVNSFLLIGYSLQDITIRLMFKLVIPRMLTKSFALMLPYISEEMDYQKREKALRYLTDKMRGSNDAEVY